MGLQEVQRVTRGYRRVTGGYREYKGLQRSTRGYGGLHGVTGVYKVV